MSEGIWISTEFPPEAERVYERCSAGNDKYEWKTYQYWNGKRWGVFDHRSAVAFINGDKFSDWQDGEYLLPAGSWAVTRGARPPLAEGTMVEYRMRGEYLGIGSAIVGNLYWHHPGLAADIIAFRLAPALKPKCEHNWAYGLTENVCMRCGNYEQFNAGSPVAGGGSQPVDASTEVRSGRPVFGSEDGPNPGHPAAGEPAPFLPYRDKRFGLLVKYAEPRSRTVPKECPVNAFNEWRK